MIDPTNMDLNTQHSVSAFFISAPMLAVLTKLPVVIPVVVGIFGIIWYSMLIGEKIYRWFHPKIRRYYQDAEED